MALNYFVMHRWDVLHRFAPKVILIEFSCMSNLNFPGNSCKTLMAIKAKVSLRRKNYDNLSNSYDKDKDKDDNDDSDDDDDDDDDDEEEDGYDYG